MKIGNILALKYMPEGSICCNVESTPGDRGSFARCSGDYVVVVSHDEDKGTTKVVKMDHDTKKKNII